MSYHDLTLPMSPWPNGKMPSVRRADRITQQPNEGEQQDTTNEVPPLEK
jgi:hypothetical protein